MLLLVDLVWSLLLDDCNPSITLTHIVMARYREGKVQLGLVKLVKLSDQTLQMMITQMAPKVDQRDGKRRMKSSGWPNVTWLLPAWDEVANVLMTQYNWLRKLHPWHPEPHCNGFGSSLLQRCAHHSAVNVNTVAQGRRLFIRESRQRFRWHSDVTGPSWLDVSMW